MTTISYLLRFFFSTVFFSVVFEFLFWFVHRLGHHSHSCLLTTFSLNFFTVSFDPYFFNRSSKTWNKRTNSNENEKKERCYCQLFCYHCVRFWPLFSFMQWCFFNFVCIPCEFGLTFVCTFTVHSLWMWSFLGHPRKMVFKPDSIITTKIPKIWNWTVFPSKQNQKYKIDVKIAAIFLCGILCTDDQFHHFEMWPNSTKVEKK